MTHYFSAVNDPNIVKELRHTIYRGKCILVVGSGLSTQAYTDEGLHPPNWVQMLEKMAQWSLEKEFIDSETAQSIFALIRDGFLVDAEKEIEECLVRNKQLQQSLREIMLCDHAKISEIHRLIVEIPFRAYLTTNYDTFIETAYLMAKGKSIVKFYETSIQNAITEYREREDRPFILKLHGDIDNPDSIILGDRGFERLLRRASSYGRDLEKLLAIASILFLGFGRADQDLEGILNKLDVFYKSNKHWMVIPEAHMPILRAKHLREDKGIRVIQYKDNQAHTELIRLLKELATPLSPMRLASEQGVRINRLEVISELEVMGTPPDTLEFEPSQDRYSSLSSSPEAIRPVEVFYAYSSSQEDENLRKDIEKRLSILKWKGLITNWYARDISAGGEKELEIKEQIDNAQIILLLVSTDFVASDYCYGNEIMLAIERHKAGQVRVLPIILRAVDYDGTPFDKIEVLPTNKIPVNSWSNKDEALFDVAMGIRKAVEELNINFWSKLTSSIDPNIPGGIAMTVQQTGGNRYDVFISYSHKDSDWVNNVLLPRLEREGLRVCIDYRDFEIGLPSLTNMELAVKQSHKTLLTLTPNWVASEWTTFESLLLQTQDPTNLRRHLLPVMVQPTTLPDRLQIFTYSDLTKPPEFESQMQRLVATIRASIASQP